MMRIRKTTAALLLMYFLGLAIAVLGPDILPARYYYDPATILEQLQSFADVRLNDSYANTAFFYRLLGFGWLWPDALANPVSYSLCFAAIVFTSGLARARWHPGLFGWFAAWNVPLAIWQGTFSKELVALLVVAAALRLSRSLRGVAIALVLALVYAVVFRLYWGLAIALALAMFAAWRMGFGWPVRLLIAALMLLSLSYAANEFAGQWLSDGRTVVADARGDDPDAATKFSNPIPNTSPLTDLANTAAGWLMLIFPAYLLWLGAFQHVLFALFQFANTLLFIRVARAIPPPRAQRTAWQPVVACIWCVAYSIVQGIFEPDYGSFVKHEANLLPMFFYLLCLTVARPSIELARPRATNAKAA